jgi:hypothetical protein
MSPSPDPAAPQPAVIHIQCKDDEAVAFVERRIGEMLAAENKMNAHQAIMRREKALSSAILFAAAFLFILEIIVLLFFEGHHQ